MAETADPLPDDTAALKAALIETRAKLIGAQALIEHLQLVIAKLKREIFGPRSERSQRLIDQLELQLEQLAAPNARAFSTNPSSSMMASVVSPARAQSGFFSCVK